VKDYFPDSKGNCRKNSYTLSENSFIYSAGTEIPILSVFCLILILGVAIKQYKNADQKLFLTIISFCSFVEPLFLLLFLIKSVIISDVPCIIIGAVVFIIYFLL